MDIVASPTSTEAGEAASRFPPIVPRRPVPRPQSHADHSSEQPPTFAKPPVVKHLYVMLLLALLSYVLWVVFSLNLH